MSNAQAMRPRLHHLVERIGAVAGLDGPAEAVAKWVRGAIPRGPVKDVLSGTPLGHAVHPLLTDLPIGTWTSAMVLDVVGGRAARPASRRLIAAGIVAAVPAATTGLNDWADTTPASDSVRRIGAVHAVANVTGLGLFAASLAARLRDRHAQGVALGLAGMGALTVGGHLGGHLSLAKAVGVDQTAFESGPAEWAEVLDDAALPADAPRGALVDGHPIVLVRRNGEVFALADRCAHRGGRLHEGELVGECVECPLHGSRFRLADGSVDRGPSAYPQPVYDVRVEGGRIAVRASGSPEP
jgi:nitrite reductase/ring-hydroxylating ferredoxin subunit/uncharacterized membrane protein